MYSNMTGSMCLLRLRSRYSRRIICMDDCSRRRSKKMVTEAGKGKAQLVAKLMDQDVILGGFVAFPSATDGGLIFCITEPALSKRPATALCFSL